MKERVVFGVKVSKLANGKYGLAIESELTKQALDGLGKVVIIVLIAILLLVQSPLAERLLAMFR